MKLLITILLALYISAKPTYVAQEVSINRCGDEFGKITLDMGDFEIIVPIKLIQCKGKI